MTIIGVTYAMGDITLGFESEKAEDGTAANDEQHTAFGASYAIAPGLSASLTMSESDVKDGSTGHSVKIKKLFEKFPIPQIFWPFPKGQKKPFLGEKLCEKGTSGDLQLFCSGFSLSNGN
ncbi:MAG: hypothetical protein CM15mP80_08630 [Alphaproteobacteria bacterium]|nr:MAG: hypothetical protein CM15mP80_08630 [Alphaproteobacteria bacterium]